MLSAANDQSEWSISERCAFKSLGSEIFIYLFMERYLQGCIKMIKSDSEDFSLLQIHILFFWIFYLSKNHEKYTSRISQKY